MSKYKVKNGQASDELALLRSRVRELEAELARKTREAPGPLTAESVGNHSGSYLRCLVSAIPDLVWLKTTEGVYLSCNEAFERFFGAKEADIVGKTDYDFVNKELADFFRLHDRKAMEADRPCVNEEWLTIAATGERQLVETIKTPMRDRTGTLIGVLGISRNITARKRTEDALERRLVALTMPLDDAEKIRFEDLFNIRDIQLLQDQFAKATGVASIITHTDGTPITVPSSFCRLCGIIRKTEKGLANCYRSDAALGRYDPDRPTVRTCLSGGLWDAGAAITVGGQHIANWLIGQVRDETQTEDGMRQYARDIGVDEETLVAAFHEVPDMSRERFEVVSSALFTLARQLSGAAYQNVQQARFINDRNQAEQALRESEERLRGIVSNTPSIVYIKDREGVFLLANPGLGETLGLSPQEIEGRSVYDLFEREIAEQRHQQDMEVFSDGKSRSFEETIPRGDGLHSYLSVKFPLHDATGHIVAVAGISTDITEQKRGEQALRESEARFKALHNASFGGIAIHDKRQLLDCNQGLADISGYTVDELVGMDGIRLIAEQSRDYVLSQISSGAEAPYEVVGLRKNGEEYPLRLEAKNIPYKGISARAVEFKDVTSRKKAENEIIRLRNYLSSIINSMPSVIIGVDEGCRITQWNVEAEKVTGILSDDACGQQLEDILPRSVLKMEDVRDAMQSQRALVNPRQTVARDGEIVYNDITIYPLDDKEVGGAVIRIDEVSERVRLEELMIQSEKMHSLGGLAAGMAHEINNPLSIIIQAAQSALRRVSSDLAANVAAAERCGVDLDSLNAFLDERGVTRYLEGILEAGKRAAEIVRNILAFSRKKESIHTLHKAEELIEQAVLLALSEYDLKKRYDIKQVEFVRQYAPACPTILVNRTEIVQVFLNVIINASQAMATKAYGAGERPTIVLRTREEGAMVRIECEDNGPGITEEVQRHVFEPFYTTKSVGVGTGLGLSVSYFIVTKNHGGTLNVTSMPGQYTVFTIDLPAAGASFAGGGDSEMA